MHFVAAIAGLTWMIIPSIQLDDISGIAVVADTWEAGLGVAVYFGPL